MEQKPEQKWEGKVSTRLTKANADQIWPLFKDFFNINKWIPGVLTCEGIHGINGEVGCVRYCAGFSVSSSDHEDDKIDGDKPMLWSKERVIAVDPKERTLSYEIVDCNIGFKSYVSTVKISPAGGDSNDGGENGCLIEWWFTVNPVDGWTFEDLVSQYERWLQSMAGNMEDDALATSGQDRSSDASSGIPM